MAPVQYVVRSIAALLALTVAARAEDTLESVQKDISERFEKIKTLTARSALNSKLEFEDKGMTLVSSGEGTLEYAFRDGKQLIHMNDSRTMETIFSSSKKVISSTGGSTLKGGIAAEYVADGEFAYTIMQGRSYVKHRIDDERLPHFGRALFEALSKLNTLRLLPDEKHENQDVYVIEAVPFNPGESPVKAVRHYFLKENGVLVKTSNHHADGRQFATTVYYNIKIDPEIDPARFKLVVPPGSTIQDMTNAPLPTTRPAKNDGSVPARPGETDPKVDPPAPPATPPVPPPSTQPAPQEPKP